MSTLTTLLFLGTKKKNSKVFKKMMQNFLRKILQYKTALLVQVGLHFLSRVCVTSWGFCVASVFSEKLQKNQASFPEGRRKLLARFLLPLLGRDGKTRPSPPGFFFRGSLQVLSTQNTNSSRLIDLPTRDGKSE